MPLQCILEPILLFPTIVEISYRLPSKKMLPIPAQKVLWGGSRQEKVSFPARKASRRHLEQKKVSFPARKVPRRHLGQKKVTFSARNGIPPAFQAEKCPNSCAEGAPRRLRGGSGQKKGGFFEIVAAMCRSYHNFLYFCALYNLKTLQNYVTYCRLRFY